MRELSPELNQLSFRVIGAAIEVHTLLGPGLLEASYEEAMTIELSLRGIPFRRQYEVDVTYKGAAIGAARLDFLIDDRLVIELKAVDAISTVHVKQVTSYLAMCGLELGLIVNFKVPLIGEMGVRRVIRSLGDE